MRRPYRSVKARIKRRAVPSAQHLPADLRRRFRPVAERFGLGVAPVPRIRLPRSARPELVTELDVWKAIDELTSVLRDVLTEAGVELVCLSRQGHSILVVSDVNRADALAALTASPRTSGLWVGSPTTTARTFGDRRSLHLREDALTVFRYLAAPGGIPVAGAEAGVVLEFWETLTRPERRVDGGRFEVGTRRARVPNPVAPYLVPQLWDRAQSDPERVPRRETPPHLLDLQEPVDVVYTWVDDTDPEWRKRRASVPPPESALATDALDPARTTNRDELRYSLRSLAMYANWVRHIWLVTDGQVPSWLNRDEPRLTVVSHPEIFADPSALPTFNSHAIESQLHHIPGLAEHYLYLNDDVFFGRPVRPELFFHGNGVAKFAVSSLALDREDDESFNGAILAARRNRQFLESRLGRTVTHRMQHIPHAHIRSTLTELEESDPELIARVARSQFRSAADISLASDLGHYYAYSQRRAVTATFAFRYVDIGLPTAAEHLASLLSNRDRDCFCINDVGGYDSPVDERQLRQFLDRYFPLPSPFELSENR